MGIMAASNPRDIAGPIPELHAILNAASHVWEVSAAVLVQAVCLTSIVSIVSKNNLIAIQMIIARMAHVMTRLNALHVKIK